MVKTKTYKTNKSKKVGDICICPVCGKSFTKKQWQQAFCCGHCKERYWNEMGDRHRPGYFDDYKQHQDDNSQTGWPMISW